MNVKSSSSAKGEITLSAESFNTDTRHNVLPVQQTFRIQAGDNRVEMELPMGKDFLTWDEFNPALYKLTATLNSGKQSEKKQVQFGMRDFKIEGKWFYVNGRKTMLRGTVENCDFPLTGYAPMDVASWERVFRICRNYGLNHMRFHSFVHRKQPSSLPISLVFICNPKVPAGLITVRDWATGSRLTNI